MAGWHEDPTSTLPPSYTTTSAEDIILRLDATPLLVSAGAPSAPAAALARLVDGGADVPVTLADAPTVAGNIISQRLRGLVAATTYRLRVNFTTSGQVRSMTTIVEVAP